MQLSAQQSSNNISRQASGDSIDYRLFTVIKNSASRKEVDGALVTLWNKYRPAVIRSRRILYEMTEHYSTPLDPVVFDDYIDECYEPFSKAVRTIELRRITNRSTWTFYICLMGYLQAHNRTIITDHLRRCMNETRESWTSGTSGDELSVFDTARRDGRDLTPLGELLSSEESSIYRTAIDRSYAKFTELQKDIWQLRLNGLNKTELSERLNVSFGDVTRNFRQMKGMIQSEIREYSARSRITSVDWK